MPADVIDIFSRRAVDPATRRPSVVVQVVGGLKPSLSKVTVRAGLEPQVQTSTRREPPAPKPKLEYMGLEEAITRIRKALKSRSGKNWSVTRGKGTAYSWISISAPPKRLVNGCMTEADSHELGVLLKKPIHGQGESIPAGSDYRHEYVARAEGREPEVYGVPYWD